MQIKYQLKQSNISNAGLGIFADEFVPKGKMVWKFRNEDHVFYNTKQSIEQKLSTLTHEEAKEYVTYMYSMDTKTAVYELDDGKYVNHSLNSNIYCINGNENCYASKDIHKGDEIVENYITSYEGENELKWLTDLEIRYNIWRPTFVDKKQNKHSEFFL